MKVTDTSEKITELLTLYGGDVSALHAAINAHIHQTEQTLPLSSPQYAKIKPIITLDNVSKTYTLGSEKIDALKNVSLSIGEGEFVAITGASGSGKSTLLHIIGCLDKPTIGNTIINQADISSLGDTALSRLRQKEIGFIFQSFYLQPFLRLKDNLAVPAMFTSQKKRAIYDRVDELLTQVGLYERRNHYPKQLSGGQIQRAAIARSLMNNPRIILADEPTGNLDSTNAASIIALFRTIRDTFGTTIIVVTHDSEVARQADRIIELRDGVVL